MQSTSGGGAIWWGLVWLLRAVLVGAAVATYGFLRLDSYWYAAGFAALIPMAFFGQYIARRQALGWIIDAAGERQKVDRWNGPYAIFNATSHTERILKEASVKEGRRKQLLWFGLWGWGFVGLAYLSWRNVHQSDLWLILFLITALFGPMIVFTWFVELGRELLYQAGWQDMLGARVMDAPPVRPGLAEVVQQKVHADGRKSSEAEALRSLRGG